MGKQRITRSPDQGRHSGFRQERRVVACIVEAPLGIEAPALGDLTGRPRQRSILGQQAWRPGLRNAEADFESLRSSHVLRHFADLLRDFGRIIAREEPPVDCEDGIVRNGVDDRPGVQRGRR